MRAQAVAPPVSPGQPGGLLKSYQVRLGEVEEEVAWLKADRARLTRQVVALRKEVEEAQDEREQLEAVNKLLTRQLSVAQRRCDTLTAQAEACPPQRLPPPRNERDPPWGDTPPAPLGLMGRTVTEEWGGAADITTVVLEDEEEPFDAAPPPGPTTDPPPGPTADPPPLSDSIEPPAKRCRTDVDTIEEILTPAPLLVQPPWYRRKPPIMQPPSDMHDFLIWTYVGKDVREGMARRRLARWTLTDILYIPNASHPCQGQYGLYARQDIPCGSILGCYAGIATPQSQTTASAARSRYIADFVTPGEDRIPGPDVKDHVPLPASCLPLLQIDAVDWGNEGRYINDPRGTPYSPNVSFETIWVPAVGEYQIVVKTTEDVPKNAELFTSYGDGYWDLVSSESTGGHPPSREADTGSHDSDDDDDESADDVGCTTRSALRLPGVSHYIPHPIWEVSLSDMKLTHARPLSGPSSGGMKGVAVVWWGDKQGYVVEATRRFAKGAVVGSFSGVVRKAQGRTGEDWAVPLARVLGDIYLVTTCFNEGRFIADSTPQPGNVTFRLQYSGFGQPYVAIVAIRDVQNGEVLAANFAALPVHEFSSK